MPSGPLSAASTIVYAVLALEPRSVVDLGMGTGKYGFLLREQTDLAASRRRDEWTIRLVGVDGYAPYVGEHQRAVYDEIVVADVRDYLRGCEANAFDVALALDIVEHFAPADGLAFLAEALRVARYVVVSTPRAFYAQDGHENQLERHWSWWPERAFRYAADRLHARLALTRDRFAVVAMLSCNGTPRFPHDPGRLRAALVPDALFFRLRGGTGPSILDDR